MSLKVDIAGSDFEGFWAQKQDYIFHNTHPPAVEEQT